MAKNSSQGWVKLWRAIADSRVFANADLLKVWVWCLVRANHTEQWITVRTGRGESEVKVEPGQFIYGRKSAAKSLKMKPTSVRSRMGKLVAMQNIALEPSTHYTLVTICNWQHYQGAKGKGRHATRQASATQVPPKCQPNATDKKVEKDKKGQEETTFVRFWATYPKPRRVKKKDARAKWPQALKEAAKADLGADDIIAALEAHAKGWEAAGTEPRHIPHPVVWLNKARWQDEAVETPLAQMESQANAEVEAQRRNMTDEEWEAWHNA